MQQLEKRLHIAGLFDFYAPLLTERQREAFTLFYEEDFSLGEIAANFGISRQAVYDLLKRTETLLENYEAALALHVRQQKREAKEAELVDLLARLEQHPNPALWQIFWERWQDDSWQDENKKD